MRKSRQLTSLSVLALVLAIVAVAVQFAPAETVHADQSPAKTVVLIGGERGTTVGTHDHPNGIRVLKTILESSPDLQAINVKVDAYPDGWPADGTVLENAATIVWYFSGSQRHPLVDASRRARFERLLQTKNIGLVAFHQASTLPADDTVIPLHDWLGGARYGLFDRTTETVDFQPPVHPTSRGVGRFTLWDEFYPTIRFQPGQRVVPILPGTFHVEIENSKPRPLRIETDKTAAWAFERSNGGRGFAYTGLHFLVSLDHPPLRRLLLNAIAWTAGIEVPTAGIRSGVPDAATKVAASVGYKSTPWPAVREGK